MRPIAVITEHEVERILKEPAQEPEQQEFEFTKGNEFSL